MGGGCGIQAFKGVPYTCNTIIEIICTPKKLGEARPRCTHINELRRHAVVSQTIV